MLLLIDIGNTDTKIGSYEQGVIKDVFHLRTLAGRDMMEYSHILEGLIVHRQIDRPQGAAICSVVPEVAPVVMDALRKSFGVDPVNVTHETRTGLRFDRGLGADRIACLVAAGNLYKGHLIVIAFGTATTFSVITEDGEYLGGAIMPGLGLSIKALAEQTASLPRVELRPPDNIPGKDTEGNILAGVVLGHAGAVGRILREISRETGRNFTVVATGGHAPLVLPYLTEVDFVNPFLTFEGLRFIYELNQ